MEGMRRKQMLEAGKRKNARYQKKISKPYINCLAFDRTARGLALLTHDKQRIVLHPLS